MAIPQVYLNLTPRGFLFISEMLKPARADLRACIYSEAKKVTSRRCGKMRARRRSGRILGVEER
jgi:hypothetical protein